MKIGVKKWGFCLLVTISLSGLSFLSPSPDYQRNVIHFFAVSAWSAEKISQMAYLMSRNRLRQTRWKRIRQFSPGEGASWQPLTACC